MIFVKTLINKIQIKSVKHGSFLTINEKTKNYSTILWILTVEEVLPSDKIRMIK